MVAINNKKLLKNNKGISLIDILIAIAVLAILITPIILQVTTTLETNAKAKEKQYVVDSATSVMEYFKQSSIDDIKKNRNVADIANISATPVTDKETCKIFVNGTDTGATVEYNVTDFELDPVNLGRAKRQYDRAVVMTDLANKLLAGKASNGKKYRINYTVDLDKSSSTYTNISNDAGFKILSDHSAVKYDDGASLKRHIIAIDCVEVTDSSYVDPNSVSLGNIQDLDADKIAIIEGDATKLDHRFEKDLIAMILDYASRHKGSNIIDENLFDNTASLNTYLKNLIRADNNTFNRMIMISVTKRVNSSGKDYFHVDVKVRYYLKFIQTDFKVFNGSNEGDMTYEVMNRDFFTSEPPDVYMVYEPFITNSSSSFTEYAYTDYITVQSDPYTSGNFKDEFKNPETGQRYDPSKIYLVKPENSWQSVTGAENGLGSLSPSEQEKKKNVFYTLSGGSFTPVKISVNQVYNSVDLGGGNLANYSPADCYPLQIITNISSYKDDSTNRWWLHNGVADPLDATSLINDTSDEVQFVRTLDSAAVPAIKSGAGEGTRAAYKLGIIADDNEIGDYHFKDGDVDGDGTVDEQIYSIVPWQAESKYSGKVYNITVTYRSGSGDETYLTGAKGAD